jgi:hypothetical protein
VPYIVLHWRNAFSDVFLIKVQEIAMPNYSLVHLLRFDNIRTFDFGSKAALSPTDVTIRC